MPYICIDFSFKHSIIMAKKTKVITEEAVAEVVDQTPPVSIMRVSDNGEVNLEGLTPAQIKRYSEISKSLDSRDLSSISSYGSDLQRAMDSYSNEFLSKQMSSQTSIESARLISDLLGELHEVNIEDLEAPSSFMRFLRRIPLLKRLVTSVEQVRMKYNTIQENIDAITKKLAATRQIAIRDNNLLQKQFENNCDYVDQIEELIIAGKLKSVEIERQLDEMKSQPELYREYQITDLEEFKNSLDMRLNDLIVLRYAFKQSLTQIRIIQRTNMLDANNTESQISMTIPLWKNQLSLAVALYNQKQSIEVKTKVTDATNQILSKNSEMMKVQSIEVARQSQRPVIDIETLRKTTQDLLETVEGIKAAQAEGAAKRAAAEEELRKLEQETARVAIGAVDSTKRIISKELRGIES